MDVKVGKLYQRVLPGNFKYPDDIVIISDIQDDSVFFYFLIEPSFDCEWPLEDFWEGMAEIK